MWLSESKDTDLSKKDTSVKIRKYAYDSPVSKHRIEAGRQGMEGISCLKLHMSPKLN